MKVPLAPLKSAVDLVRGLNVDSMTVHVDPEGWKVSAMDASRTLMTASTLDKSLFDEKEYETFKESFTVDIDHMNRTLGLMSGETVDMEVAGGKIVFSSGGMKSSFGLNAYDETVFRDPNFSTDVSTMIDAEDLRRIVKAVSNLKDSAEITFEVSESGVDVQGEDGNGNKVALTIAADDCGLLEGTGKSTFPIKAFASVIGVVPKGAILDIKFGTDLPIIISWGGTGWSSKWIAAPMITTDG